MVKAKTDQISIFKWRLQLFQIFLQTSFSKKSADIICFLPCSDFINTTYHIQRFHVSIPHNIAPAVDPDWLSFHIQPAVFHVVSAALCTQQIFKFRLQKRIIRSVYKLSVTFHYIMKSILGNAEPLHCLRRNVIKICSEINQIKVVVCAGTEQINDFAKLFRGNILILFLLENILRIFLCQQLFHAGCCLVHACTVQLFPALIAVKHGIASLCNILKSIVFVWQIKGISSRYP